MSKGKTLSFRISLLTIVGAFAVQVAAADDNHVRMPSALEGFFGNYCYNCHDGDTQKGDLNLEALTRVVDNATDAQHWQDVLDQINAGEMPPKKKKQPTKKELATAISHLTETLHNAQASLKDSGGTIAVRRLNRREYQTTVADLMGVNLDLKELPDDASGRFDTIGQNQSLSAMELQKYSKVGQEVARTALHWATQERSQSKVIRTELANTEKRSKNVYDVFEKIKLVKEEGKTPEEAGLTKKEWAKYNPDGANAANAVWRGQREYYERNLAIHDKGRMLSHDLLVETANLFFPHDPRAGYTLRFCGGVVDGVKIRRAVRVMKKKGGLGGKHGTAIGSFLVSGSLEETSVHEMSYQPVLATDFRPRDRNSSRRFIFFLEDKRGGPASEQFYHEYMPIEPDVPKDVIFAKWIEVEGPFYGSTSPFEALVTKYAIASATDAQLDPQAGVFLREFAQSAFRQRAIPDGFIEKLLSYYQDRRQAGASFREAIIDPLALILSSTRFLYLIEPNASKEAQTLDAVSVANRLSYFLWSAPPDAELLALAEKGELLQAANLTQQVDRMLASPKAEAFFQGFMAQWMHLNRFDNVGLNSKLLLHRTDGMIHASKREPIEFFKTIVRENLSAGTFIDSDFVMLNGILAIKYGLTERYSGDGFKKVPLPKNSPRGGLMTQAAFLSTGTMGNRTSPVIRGSLVKEILLNDPPPPPPPNVPELVAAGTDPLASVRSLVELHQKKAQCASCHARFDFIGLGLENFDAVGLWRDEELVTNAQRAKQIPRSPKKIYPVDASGSLPNGATFKDVHGLKAALMKDKRKVAGSILEGLLCYALGRDASFTDRPFIKSTLDDLEATDYPVRDMIKKVVTSKQFRRK